MRAVISGCSVSRGRLAGGGLLPYQNLEQLLQVAGDEGVVFVERPAALLRIVAVTGEVAEDDLQPLLVVTHLPPGQRCTQVLRGRETAFKPDAPVPARGRKELVNLKVKTSSHIITLM